MAYTKQIWVDGESAVNAERLNHIEDAIYVVSGCGVGERLGDNMITDPLNISLKTGTYGLYSEAPGTKNLPESGVYVGFANVVNFDTNWQYAKCHNFVTGNTYYNIYKSGSGGSGWSGWSISPLGYNAPKCFSGAYFNAQNSSISSTILVSCTPLGNDIYTIQCHGTYAHTQTATGYNDYGFNLNQIASQLKYTSGALLNQNNSFAFDCDWTIYDRSANSEYTAGYGYKRVVRQKDNGRVNLGRIYQISSGTGDPGEWPLHSLPKSGFITATIKVKFVR